MKRNNLIILANSKHSDFGLGDYLRILSFVPNLKYQKYIWISDRKLFPIAKNCDFLSKIYEIQSKYAKKIIKRADLVIDLYQSKKKLSNSILVKKLIRRTNNVKINTVDICDVLAREFRIKNFKLFNNLNKNFKKNIIFFNWITPKISTKKMERIRK